MKLSCHRQNDGSAFRVISKLNLASFDHMAVDNNVCEIQVTTRDSDAQLLPTKSKSSIPY